MVRGDVNATSPLSAHKMPPLMQVGAQSAKSASEDPKFEQFRLELEEHFNQETRSKKRIHELEQKQETAKLNIVNKNNEITILQTKENISIMTMDQKGPIETS